MADSLSREKRTESYELSSIVREESPNSSWEAILNQGFEFDKMIYDDEIIFEVINRENRRCPDIRE